MNKNNPLNNMAVSEKGLSLIRRFEGFSPLPYLCPAGLETIGYGHLVRAGESFPPGGITQETANAILLQDIKRYERAVARLVKIPLNQNQFDALVSLVYNIGEHAFEKSTLLRLLNQHDPANASREFNRWVYARGKKLDGLVRRRAAETQMFQEKTDF